MKKIFTGIVVLVFCLSCTDRGERDDFKFDVSINNTSSESLTLLGYAPNNDLVINNVILNPNSIGAECSYNAEMFSGYICGVDSLIFKFSNGKGYICSYRITNNQPELCFPNKTPFGSDPSFLKINKNTFQFLITEEDFVNAYDLP
jgi:hypothetical protein